MKYKTYSRHLYNIHGIKIANKRRLDLSKCTEEAADNVREAYEDTIRDEYDNRVLKKALDKIVMEDYIKGVALRHYTHRPPPVPVDETNETIQKLTSELKTKEGEITIMKSDLDRLNQDC